MKTDRDDDVVDTQVTFVRVVECLAGSPSPLLVSDIITSLELSRGQARGALATGLSMGWIQPCQTTVGTAYTLTQRLTELGFSLITQRAFVLRQEMHATQRALELLQQLMVVLAPSTISR